MMPPRARRSCSVSTWSRSIKKMQARGASIPIAVDVVVGKNFAENEPAVLKSADAVADDEMIFDIGPQSAAELAEIDRTALRRRRQRLRPR